MVSHNYFYCYCWWWWSVGRLRCVKVRTRGCHFNRWQNLFSLLFTFLVCYYCFCYFFFCRPSSLRSFSFSLSLSSSLAHSLCFFLNSCRNPPSPVSMVISDCENAFASFCPVGARSPYISVQIATMAEPHTRSVSVWPINTMHTANRCARVHKFIFICC